jgi:hypothetical protein
VAHFILLSRTCSLPHFTLAICFRIVVKFVMSDYTISPARYAKKMMAVHCISDGTGWMTRAMHLADHFARSRYSGRENAYIMSKAASAKFEAAYVAGKDASPITGEMRE